MKPSIYNEIITFPNNPHKHILYNTFRDHQLLITDGELNLKDIFSKIENKKTLTSDETNYAIQLKELGIVLDDNVDEFKVFEKWLYNKVQNSKDHLTATIFVTHNCNLRCTYCFESDLVDKHKMSERTTQQTTEWLIRKIVTDSPKNVHLEFFGGEPLLNIPCIISIGETIRDFCYWKNIEYTSGVVTNGVLLTKDAGDKLKDVGINQIKVTLDGDALSHDKKRKYLNGKGTFDKIIQNLEDNTGKFNIYIGGNFDETNIIRFSYLLDILKNCKFKEDIAHINFKPIIPNFGKKLNHDSHNNCDTSSFKKNDLIHMFSLRDLIHTAGFSTFDQIAIGPCEFYRRNSVSIDVNGYIYNCLAFVGRRKFIASDVRTDNFLEEGEKQLSIKPWRINDSCKSCTYLPICAGGCRATAWDKTGSLEAPSCDKTFFKKIIDTVLLSKFQKSGANK